MVEAFKTYIEKKLNMIEKKANNTSKINACMSLKEYYEKFCNRFDNPTFNMLEVAIKKTINGALQEEDND